MYIGPLTEGDQASGTITGATITKLEAFVTAMLGAFSSTDQFMWVVWSETGAVSNEVTNVLVRPVMGTQRRRRPGVGS